MSKWTEVRDSIVEALQVEEVGHDLKTRFVDWLGDEGIAFIQPIADAIVEERLVQNQRFVRSALRCQYRYGTSQIGH